MNELISLSRMVTSCYSVSSSLPDKNLKGKEGFFIDKLMQRCYETDMEAASELYCSNPNDVRYKMLKHRIKKKFYNNLFFINYSKLQAKPFLENEQECYMLLHHSNLFLRQNDFKLAELNSKKVVNIADEYGFLNLKIAALEIIRSCSSESGALKQYRSVSKQLDKLLRQKYYEEKAVSLFELIRLILRKSVKSRKEYLPKLAEDINKLENLWKKAQTFESYNAYYRAYIWYYELTGDFSKIVELTIFSQKLIEESKINALRFDTSFNKFILVYAHLRAGKHAEGLIYAEKFLEGFSQNSHNWFAYLENYFLLAIHSKKYELADTLLHKVFSNIFYSKLSAAAKERWQLYQAYLSIVDNSSKDSKFKNPYLLSLPEYSKDKQGFNVAILVLQLLHFLQRKDLEALLYRIESLKKYVHTHLKDTFSLRSKLFLKLLILAVTEDFDAESIKRKGRKYFEKLNETPTPGDAYAEIEIVPYEHLWELILDVLQKKY